MTTKFTDSEELTTNELTNFIRSQASALSLVDLDQLVTDLPALRERFAKIPFRTYPYLSAELEFLALSVEEHVVRRSRELEEEVVAEAAFALLYFQHATDLIPDAIPDMGLLDDAIIVGIVLRRQEQAFKASAHARMLRWSESKLEVAELLSVISPLRVASFCLSAAIRPAA
jgi:uncharacterized membrane protein YkvA (DUF1232 family)